MSKKGMNHFIGALQRKGGLSDEFARAVADFAQAQGFDVDEQDVKILIDEQPSVRPVPDERGKRTTLALGEEDAPRRATTMAVGEEGRNPRKPKPTSAAIGEEDKKPKKRDPRP